MRLALIESLLIELSEVPSQRVVTVILLTNRKLNSTNYAASRADIRMQALCKPPVLRATELHKAELPA